MNKSISIVLTPQELRNQIYDVVINLINDNSEEIINNLYNYYKDDTIVLLSNLKYMSLEQLIENWRNLCSEYFRDISMNEHPGTEIEILVLDYEEKQKIWICSTDDHIVFNNNTIDTINN